MPLLRFLIVLLLASSLESCQSETPAAKVIKRQALVEGVTFEFLNHLGNSWQVVTVDPAKARPSIRHSDEAGKPVRDFAAFNQAANKAGEKTVWMMNAGMYHKAGSPVGLCICDGKVVGPVNQSGGSGNFFLKPNGIFFLTDKKAGVIDTNEWNPAMAPTARSATQSGPLLVRRGKFHPVIRANSPNKLIRNGVGVRADGYLCFVISTTPVSFHDMAILFRDHLKCPDALYLDGNISALYAPKAGLNNLAEGIGPVIGFWE